MLVIVSVTVFAAIMGALAPTIVSLYLQYIKEPTAPQILINHPFQIPFLGMFMLIAISLGFLIYALMREAKRNKNSVSDLSKALGIVDKLLSDESANLQKRDVVQSLNSLAEQIRLYREAQAPRGDTK